MLFPENLSNFKLKVAPKAKLKRFDIFHNWTIWFYVLCLEVKKWAGQAGIGSERVFLIWVHNNWVGLFVPATLSSPLLYIDNNLKLTNKITKIDCYTYYLSNNLNELILDTISRFIIKTRNCVYIVSMLILGDMISGWRVCSELWQPRASFCEASVNYNQKPVYKGMVWWNPRLGWHKMPTPRLRKPPKDST